MREGVVVRREVFLGESKLDFLVGDTFLEVKTLCSTCRWRSRSG